MHVAFSLMTVINKVSSMDALQFLLVQMDRIMDGKEKTFLDLEKLEKSFPFEPLVKFFCI